MRSFELFLDVLGDWVSISLPLNSTQMNGFSTYDEKLDESENSQYTLSFSVIKERNTYNGLEQNPLLSFFFLGAKIFLILDGGKRIDFIIKDMAPTTYQSNAAYQITAQDEFSYLLAKHRQGYNYSTINADGILAPKSIFTIAEEVFAECFIDEWTVTNRSIDSTLYNLPFTLEITNSNPYNVLIEGINTINAYMDVNYYSHQVDFYRKDLIAFSGYRYNTNYNAVTYKASYSNDEFATILHVNGGTDANEQQVTIIPSMPQSLRRYIYLKTNQTKEWPLLLSKKFSWTKIAEEIDNNKNLYYPRFSPAFLPFVKGEVRWEENLISWKGNIVESTGIILSSVPLISIVYNDLKGCYEGIISFSDDINKDDYRITFVADPNFKNGFTHADVKNDGDKIKYYFAWNWVLFKNNEKIKISSNVDGKQSKFLTLWQTKASKEQAKEKLKAKEKTYLDEFFAVTQKVPYLSQSLVDFSPYRPYMTKEKWDALDQLINMEWRNCNIQLQYYTTEFYQAASSLVQVRSRIKIYGENYLAACNAYKEVLKGEETDTKEAAIAKAKNEIELRSNELRDVIKNSGYLDLIILLGISEELYIKDTEDFNNPSLSNCALYYFKQERDQQLNIRASYQEELSSLASASEKDSYANSQLQAERDYLIKKINTISDFVDDYIIINNVQYDGMYALIIKYISQLVLESQQIDFSLKDGLASKYEVIQKSINNRVLAPLYRDYGQFVYELSYDNNEEISSIALYNQAISYFADVNKVKGSHSLEVLDIGSLEQVNIPRLRVGSIIQVYNSDSINALPYQSLLAQINRARVMIEFYTGSNDIDNLIDKKRKLEEELAKQYNIHHGTELTFNEVMNIICYDELLVTGISRVLREPLKDSVTVQQPSRYKTILSKLIKSI